MGGLSSIIEKQTSSVSEKVLDKIQDNVPLPELPFYISKYNDGFVNFCMLVGLFTSVKLGIYGVKKIYKTLTPNKELSKKDFLERYGEGSWAVIADVANNEQYCLYLARQGLNLILMGDINDIQIVRDMVSVENIQTRTITYPADWAKKDFSFQQFAKDIKDYDISFLVLPKTEKVSKQSSFGTHVEQIPAFQHFYLLVRYLGPQLQWRSYQSAIILPSHDNVGQIISGHGVTQGINSALDALMRTLNFELKNSIDVIAARGTVQQCFKDLGKTSISH